MGKRLAEVAYTYDVFTTRGREVAKKCPNFADVQY